MSGEKVSADDFSHEPSSEQPVTPTPAPASFSSDSAPTTGVSVAPEDKAHEGYVPSQTKHNPVLAGGVGAAIGVGAGKIGKGAEFVYNKLNKTSPGAVQNYADTTLAELTGRNLHVPLKDMASLSGMPEVRTYEHAAQAARRIAGSAAQPDTVQHVYERHPVTGQPVHKQTIITPGQQAVPGIDAAKLAPYEKGVAHYAKKFGIPTLRAGVAGYDIGRGLDDPTSIGGAVDIAAGLSSLAAPFLPGKIKTAANVVGALPIVGSLIPGANAAPMRPEQVAGSAVDLATGLMSPSELGEGTVQPRDEAYYPGMTNILQGTTLPPKQFADGGSTSPEFGTAQAYEPSYSEKIRDYAAQYLSPEQADAIFGGPRATTADKLNPIGWAAQTPGAIADAAKGFIENSKAGNYLGAMGNYLEGAMNVAPMMGPTKAVGKAAVESLGPKAAHMVEDYLTKIGGIQHIMPTDTKIMRASEALAPHEGKWLNTTQSDRMRSTEGDLGGPGFSRFQQVDPNYAEAAWGVGKPGTATAIINVNKKYPEGQAIWSPMIGAETQHHSNQHVHDALVNEFNRQAGMGKLTPELRAEMNNRLTQYPEYANLFKKGIDVGNPESLKQMGDTFDRRAAISSVLSGKGVGGTKGQIFDYPGIMQEMTDPMTIGAPTHSVGTRLFTLSNEMEHRPDLHSAFPYILKGQDQGVAFTPVPKELAIPDWMNLVREFKGREPGYMDYTRGLKGKGTPNQFISDKYLRSLEEAGHAEGGSVEGYAPGGKVLGALGKLAEEAQAAYKAKFTPGFFHGSPSPNIEAFDPLKSAKDPMYVTPKATFVTRDPEFAESFLSMNNSGRIKSGSTMYPVSVDLNQHWSPDTAEGKALIKDFIEKYPKRVNLEKGLSRGDWTAVENSDFLTHLKDNGYDTFHVMEGGIPNVGVLDPSKIRGKFAAFNPEEAASPDFMKAKGGKVKK